jgi:ribosomal protein L3 glutamine methyltransferase
VLDLCTGNGSLAVLAALAWPEVHVDAADISADALAVARINVDRHGLQDRIRCSNPTAWRNGPARYDLILCNPPYVNAAAWPPCPPNTAPSPPGAGGRRRRHGLRPPAAADAAARLSRERRAGAGNRPRTQHFESAFPALEAVWLDTSAATTRCLLVTRDALHAWQNAQPAQKETP